MSGEGRVLRTARLIAFLDRASPSLLEFLTREHDHDLVDQVRERCLAGDTPSLALVDLAEERVLLYGPWTLDEHPAIENDVVQTLTLDTTAEIAVVHTSEGRLLADTYLWRGHVPAGGFVYRPAPGVDHRVTISWAATPEGPHAAPTPAEPVAVEPAAVEPVAVEPVAVEPPTAETPTVEAPADEPAAPAPPSVEPVPPAPAPPPELAVPEASDPFDSEIFDDPGLDLAALGRGEIRTTEPLADQQPEPTEDASAVEPLPAPTDRAPEPIAGPDRDPPDKVINLTDPSAAPPAWQFREPPSAGSAGPENSKPAAATTTPPAPSHQSFREPGAPDAAAPVGDATLPGAEVERIVSSAARRRAVIDFGDLGQRTIGHGIVVGRNPTRISVEPDFETIVVPDSEVSRAHAKMWVADTELVVQDLGSANGSILHRVVGSRHDVPTEPDALTMLVGDELEIGAQRILFVGWDFDG